VHRAGSGGVAGFSRIPLRPYRYLYPSVAVDVVRRKAYVIPLGKLICHYKTAPVSVTVPYKLLLVGEQNIRLPVAINVSHRQTVANGDCIKGLRFEMRSGRLGKKQRTSSPAEEESK
jgi:hypothetical protein